MSSETPLLNFQFCEHTGCWVWVQKGFWAAIDPGTGKGTRWTCYPHEFMFHISPTPFLQFKTLLVECPDHVAFWKVKTDQTFTIIEDFAVNAAKVGYNVISV